MTISRKSLPSSTHFQHQLGYSVNFSVNLILCFTISSRIIYLKTLQETSEGIMLVFQMHKVFLTPVIIHRGARAVTKNICTKFNKLISCEILCKMLFYISLTFAVLRKISLNVYLCWWDYAIFLGLFWVYYSIY